MDAVAREMHVNLLHLDWAVVSCLNFLDYFCPWGASGLLNVMLK